MSHRHRWIAMTDCSARCIYIDDEHNYCRASLSKEEVDRRLNATEYLSADVALETADEYGLKHSQRLREYAKTLRGEK